MSSAESATAWIARLQLAPHPEGGHFRRFWASSAESAPGRPAATAIYYLLEAGSVSRLHSLRSSEEVWLWHAGGALTVVEVEVAAEAGGRARVRSTELGPGAGVLTHVVPAGRIFGARLPAASPWALVSCVVSPGFDFAEWRLEPLTDALRACLTPDEVAQLEPLVAPLPAQP